MTEKLQIFKCQKCGNIVEVIHAGVGQLVCCGLPMHPVVKNAVEASKEKHVPVLEKVEGGYRVQVGSVPHPMEEQHYIEWIELTTADGKSYRQFLNPGEAPEAFFATTAQSVTAREYCNLHGLW